MAFRGCGLVWFLVGALVSLAGEVVSSAQYHAASLNRSSFPAGFIFGTASAAYQYEGAVKEGGRGPSIWDTFAHKHPEKIKDRSNGDIAIDFYHRYKEDVRIMKDMGTNAFRLSISWTRILPRIEPFVTLFHWDSPQTLEDDYNGFLSSNIVADYRNYVDVCFREFGDRVKHWITFNEPTIFCNGYLLGSLAPGRCSSWVGNCSTGNSATEPYIVGHHLLLAHAAAVKLYREKYKASQKGNVGITLTTRWYIPLSSSKSDLAAVQRTLDFSYGWFIDPITRGDYPSSMRSLVGRRLPKFSKEQSEMLKGSFDFIGINYYSTYYAADAPPSNDVRSSYLTDARSNTTGVPDINNKTLPLHEALEDNMRLNYHRGHLSWLHTAIREGVDVRGYFAWSFMDNFEWADGYTVRFGINYVDYQDGLKRYPKKSAIWFKKFLKGESSITVPHVNVGCPYLGQWQAAYGDVVDRNRSTYGEVVSSGQNKSASLNRSSFPAGFIFGTASAAYQYEGSVASCFKHSMKVRSKKVAEAQASGTLLLTNTQEDVRIMKEMGMDAYRFSISWSRILPNGRLSGGVDKEGIKYYNNLIDELISNGIKPFVTLFHWDSPQKLEDDYNGFLSYNIVTDFRDYADICFREFGDRVKHWITLNEPSSFCIGYTSGTFAPGRCSSWVGNCSTGNSATEPYIVAHHQLLAHAAAVKIYREKYKASQKGVVGITLATAWYIPYSSSKSDHDAAKRAFDFANGWFIDPITRGDYPSSMRSLIGKRLPKFSKEQSVMLKGSFDFLGLNYYTSNYAANAPQSRNVHPSSLTDARTNITALRNGVLIGPQAASSWLHVYPKGIRDLLRYTKKRYDNPIIYITENGVSEFNNRTLPLHQQLEDNMRIDYYRDHLSWLHTAIREGVDVKGYFAWSLLDNFEWADGYTVRFGINYVDYEDGEVVSSAQNKSASLNRSSFPAGFIFGTASAAYQYEGAVKEGGRGPSIWDTFTHKHPEKIKDRSNGDIAIDSYHRYKEDVRIMKEMGMDAYRFSISWTRILPNGGLSGGVNKEGIKYYNNLIDELISNDVCFGEFGDRVKHWITLNEPSSFCIGYTSDTSAPGRCSSWVGNCSTGNSATEPYIVAHHQLLAHAAAVKLYREKYKASQKGVVGITLATAWYIPYSSSKSDHDAAKRAFDFANGWFVDPITRGDYPSSMRSLVGKRLPKFSIEQSVMLKGSFDFLGLNYYTANYAANAPQSKNVHPSSLTDARTNNTALRNGVLIGPQAASSWLYVYPKGIRDLLLYVKKRYDNPIIYITENGKMVQMPLVPVSFYFLLSDNRVSEFNNRTLPLHKQLEDNMRIDYHRDHLSWLHTAIREGVDVKGYFAWSLMDNFEWSDGYTVRFGINYVDYEDGLKRYPKKSAIWFKKFLRG
ncbi:Beta-glucosidase 12 [Cinnamomum micranthum f. kanehirae]|uniref:Beta-glucosidase 12 n=1 Tax=Cinnamomum micranthum f. kanehirae TaxID=337451 RepID=A0A443NH57_9MAGN|nr:Beta-glucosidase 12 [Cinnamomum micranthum f. kanehirae]